MFFLWFCVAFLVGGGTGKERVEGGGGNEWIGGKECVGMHGFGVVDSHVYFQSVILSNPFMGREFYKNFVRLK